MKTNNMIISVFAMLIVLLCGCERIVEDGKIANTHSMDVTVSATTDLTKTSINYDSESKMYLPSWTATDKLGVYTTLSGIENNSAVEFSINGSLVEGAATSFVGTLTNSGEGNYQFYAYYPYVDEIVQTNPSHTSVSCILPTQQSPTPTSFDGAADVLVALPVEKTITAEQSSVNDINFRFARKIAVVKLNLSSFDSAVEGDIVKSVRLTVADKVLSGSYSLDLTSATTSSWSGNNYVQANYNSSSYTIGSDAFTAWMTLNPITVEVGKVIEVKVITNNRIFKKSITVPASQVDFAEGRITTLNVGMAGTQTNASPSNVAGITALNVKLGEDSEGFNMLSDGGFENYPLLTDWATWKNTSLWYFPDWISFASPAYSGNHTVHADLGVDAWRDVAVQSINVKKNSNYVLTVDFKAAWNGVNVFMGFRATPQSDHNTNTAGVGANWNNYSHTWNNVNNTEGTAFLGGSGWPGLWIEADNFKVIPEGYSHNSYKPMPSTAMVATVKNATFSEVSSCNQMVIWPIGLNGSDNYGVAMSNVTIDGVVYENAYANAKASNNGTLTINSFANGGANMIVHSAGETQCIPTSGFSNLDGSVQYVNYYAVNSGDPATEDTWTSAGSHILKSEDNGKTWTKMNALSRSGASKFTKATFMKIDDYVYIYGTNEGREGVNTFCARVLISDFETYSSWRYWNGANWDGTSESDATSIFYGSTAEMTVFWTNKTQCYTAIYRSRRTGALVYRESKNPEGNWSGEKIFASDPIGGQYYVPSVILYTSENSDLNNPIYIITAKISDGYGGGGDL